MSSIERAPVHTPAVAFNQDALEYFLRRPPLPHLSQIYGASQTWRADELLRPGSLHDSLMVRCAALSAVEEGSVAQWLLSNVPDPDCGSLVRPHITAGSPLSDTGLILPLLMNSLRPSFVRDNLTAAGRQSPWAATQIVRASSRSAWARRAALRGLSRRVHLEYVYATGDLWDLAQAVDARLRRSQEVEHLRARSGAFPLASDAEEHARETLVYLWELVARWRRCAGVFWMALGDDVGAWQLALELWDEGMPLTDALGTAAAAR